MIDLSKHIQEGARLELEALELSTDECSFMSAQNSAQAMQIDELKRDLAAAKDTISKYHERIISQHAQIDDLKWSLWKIEGKHKAAILEVITKLAAAQEALKAAEARVRMTAQAERIQIERAQRAEAALDALKAHAEAMAEELQWIACRYDDSKSTRECAADAYEMKSAAAQALHAYRAAHQDGGAK